VRWTQERRLIAILSCAALAYLPVFANGFVYDDTALIVDSRVIHDLRNFPALFTHSAMYASAQYSGGVNELDTYRPVTIATFMWDALLSGTAPWAYHLTNLLAHLACVFLVYRLARALLAEQDREFAWLAAAWFAFAPVPSEAHVWINGRSDVFATLFGLAGVLSWRRGLAAEGPARAGFLAAAAFGFLLGLLSKEVLLLCLPAIALWPERSPTGLVRRGLRCLPLAAAGAIYLALRLHALGGMRSHQSAAQLGLAARRLPWLLLDGLLQSVLPTQPYQRLLYEEYARLPAYVPLLAGAVLLLMAAAAFWYRRTAPAVGWGLLWFALPLAPVAVITTVYWPGFGRYLYLPCVGLAIALSTLAARAFQMLVRLRRVFGFAALAYAAILIFVLEPVVASYRDSTALYMRTIDHRPDLAYGYGVLAASMSTQLNDLDEVSRLLELAERLDPSVPRYAIHRVQTELVLKRPERAAAAAEQALARFPAEPMLHYLAAVATTADPERALQHVLACLRLQPDFARCRSALGELCADPSQCELLTRAAP
jgi:protein O-mannosyl-transferase